MRTSSTFVAKVLFSCSSSVIVHLLLSHFSYVRACVRACVRIHTSSDHCEQHHTPVSHMLDHSNLNGSLKEPNYSSHFY